MSIFVFKFSFPSFSRAVCRDVDLTPRTILSRRIDGVQLSQQLHDLISNLINARKDSNVYPSFCCRLLNTKRS